MKTNWNSAGRWGGWLLLSALLAAASASAAPRMAPVLRTEPGYAFLTADLEKCAITKYNAAGQATWSYVRQVKPIDAWALADGSVLMAYLPSPLTRNLGGVRRVDAAGRTLFDLPIDDEIMSVQPLENGRFLVSECHAGRITEMDGQGIRFGSFPVATPPSGHKTVRQIRLTSRGTVLAAETYSHKLREYARDGQVRREFDLRFPYYPLPLPDGRTLVGCWNFPEAQVVELDAEGKTVWSVKASELPKELGVTHIAGVARLPNGHTLVATSCKAGRAPAPRAMLFEITPDLEIVWQMQDPDGSSWLTLVRLLGPEPEASR